MSARRAVITGIGGQDGSLLAELLLEKGYAVFGVVRRPKRYENLAAVEGHIELLGADLGDPPSLVRALEQVRPHEVYNLASISFAPTSWEQPLVVAECAVVGVTALLEAIRHVDPAIRFYQASSSEIFGRPTETPQRETTPVSPLNPYGVAKTYGHFITRSYRHRYGLHASSGILYNHESERRPLQFLPRKVARGAAAIALGLSDELLLGDLDARRDWGYARDYVRAMWLMLQREDADDFVVATGITHTVEDLVACAFGRVDRDWREFVKIDRTLQRGPAQLQDVVGDSSKARAQLGWEPSVTFEELVHLLVDSELEQLQHRATGASKRRA